MTKMALTDYIVELKGLLSRELCQQILSKFELSNEFHKGSQHLVDYNRNLIKVAAAKFDAIVIPNESELGEFLQHKFNVAFEEYKLQVDMHVFEIDRDRPIAIQRYVTGADTENHVDSSRDNPPHLTCSIALNDDFSGGELSFFNSQYFTGGGAGTAILFPGNFMYPHKVETIKSGTRYSLVKRW
jgi:hypothetical protein